MDRGSRQRYGLCSHGRPVRSLLLAVPLLAGCEASLGGASGNEQRGPQALQPDAGTAAADAATPTADAPVAAVDNACGVASDHGNLGMLTATAGSVAQSGSTTLRTHYLDAPTPATATQTTPDVLMVELWDDYGAFAGGPARTGTFTLAGNETDYDTCGVCVLLAANVAANVPSKLLLATAGTVTVTSIGTGTGQTTQATITNATFVEIAFDQTAGWQTVAGSTCPSPIANAVLRGTL